MTLEDKAFILSFHKRETSWNARDYRSHSAPDNLLQCLYKRELFPVERRILRDDKDELWRTAFVQFSRDFFNEEFAAGNREAIFWVEVLEVW